MNENGIFAQEITKNDHDNTGNTPILSTQFHSDIYPMPVPYFPALENYPVSDNVGTVR